MRAPDINLEELKRFKEENFRERLAFLDKYADWLKRTPNSQWSKQQKNFLK
ncbi:MAG TPA: hypothetical protein VJK52_06150 [Candidatus Nanoarchaeia archaeon]|nr:hypothetical protein [Candidatus Nanoarchaeia archaeon]